MTDETAERFNLANPLPTGRLAIEASAGTGKTYALTGLAVRLLAEGVVTTSELLLVTFTRAATEELRSRVRERLAAVADVLEGGDDPPDDDAVLEVLCRTDRQERADRLRTALAEFDAVTIITIHGFARQVHRTLGISADIDPDADLVTDVDALVDEICVDLLAREAVDGVQVEALPSVDVLRKHVVEALRRPGIDIRPRPGRPPRDGGPSRADVLCSLVVRAVEEFDERRVATSAVGFDELLTRLRAAVADPTTGPGVVEALRGRYRAVLIDEFQDTDGIQWEIFETLFGDPGAGTVLVTVGDPKQAIYRFRGADIHTYLKAVGDPSTRRATLGTNWRSDGPVLRALETLLSGATFGDPAIRFDTVEPAPGAEDRRIARSGVTGDPPVLDLRLLAPPDIGRSERDDTLLAEPTRAAVGADLVRYVHHVLDDVRLPAGDGGEHVPAVPGDIAVLVTTNRQAEEFRAALLASSVPAVVNADGNVLASDAARQVRVLLAAMERPFDPGLVRAYAASWFVGWAPDSLPTRSDREWSALQESLARWSGRLGERPVAEVFSRIWWETGVVARVLGGVDGDRRVTDLEHLVELLHESAPRGRCGVPGLLAVLEAPPEAAADTESGSSVAARRIESQGDAVQIMTVWKAKGLEFPVVCLPTLWARPKSGCTVFADPGGPDEPVHWTLEVTPSHTARSKAAASGAVRADAEVAGEELRQLYVALTRACHLLAVWWADSGSARKSALARVLFGRVDGRIDPTAFGRATAAVPDDGSLADTLAPTTAVAGGSIDVTVLDDPVPDPPRRARPRVDDEQLDGLTVAPFTRELDRRTSRWSFTSITGQVADALGDPADESGADAGASDERGADDGLLSDGPAEDVGSSVPRPAAGPLGGLAAGAEFGTLVHAVLEQVDFTSPDLDAVVGAAVVDQLGTHPVALAPPDGTVEEVEAASLLAGGLAQAIRSPLGPLFGGRTLADLGPRDTLRELGFDLRLTEDRVTPTLAEVVATVRAHLAGDDPFAPWADGLARSAPDLPLVGYLTGSIDLVARVESAEGPTWVVADYKSNLLTPRGSEPSAADYDERAMVGAMGAHHYPLQALIYSVALHRYLRWRLPDYRPEAHLGGAAYLFVRGMTPDGPRFADGSSFGVVSWPVPPALVSALSDLFAGQAGGGRG